MSPEIIASLDAIDVNMNKTGMDIINIVLAFVMFGVAMCASLAMILPISTPPNALAHSTGIINTKQMAIVGVIVGVVGIILAYTMLVVIGF